MSGTKLTEIDRLQKLQSRVARIVANSSYDAPSMPLIRSLGSEAIEDLINQEIKTIPFRSVNKLAPQYLIDLFTRNSHFSAINFRNIDSDVQIQRLQPLIPKLLTTALLCCCCCYPICGLDRTIVPLAVGSRFEKKNIKNPATIQ